MRVTFLGTGSAMPTGARYQAGIVLEDGDQRLLVDCGAGVLQRLQQHGPGYEAISTVLLTHHHLDHVTDLMPLLKARWLAGAESMTIVGPEGTQALVDELLAVHEYMQDRIAITVRDIGPGEWTVNGFDLRARWTDHSMPCLAYRFDDRFGFSGDSAAIPELAAFFDGVGVLAHDCSFPDGIDVSNHPTPTRLAAAFEDAKADVGRLYLTHLYPHTEGAHEAMIDTVAERTGIETRIPEDGLTVRIDQVTDH